MHGRKDKAFIECQGALMKSRRELTILGAESAYLTTQITASYCKSNIISAHSYHLREDVRGVSVIPRPIDPVC